MDYFIARKVDFMGKDLQFTRIGYSYLPTTDIDASIAWYTENLGLQLGQKFEDRGSFIAPLQYPHKNAIALVLIETTDAKPLEITRNGALFPVLAMNCPNIEYTHQFLSNKGIAVEELHTLGDGEAKYFYFRDDQGNYIEAAWSQWDPVDEIKDNFK